ncbi:hypothetical protein WJX73_001186 [Symbiochloris irregularis]|uniref:Uncharacterized protein n=1 Tax=Symbiochloris irregularis TaxID=706552 RepID=A0AAW1NL73_9CHLO
MLVEPTLVEAPLVMQSGERVMAGQHTTVETNGQHTTVDTNGHHATMQAIGQHPSMETNGQHTRLKYDRAKSQVMEGVNSERSQPPAPPGYLPSRASAGGLTAEEESEGYLNKACAYIEGLGGKKLPNGAWEKLPPRRALLGTSLGILERQHDTQDASTESDPDRDTQPSQQRSPIIAAGAPPEQFYVGMPNDMQVPVLCGKLLPKVKVYLKARGVDLGSTKPGMTVSEAIAAEARQAAGGPELTAPQSRARIDELVQSLGQALADDRVAQENSMMAQLADLQGRHDTSPSAAAINAGQV